MSKLLKEICEKKKYEIEGYIITVPEPKFFELKNDIKNKVWYTLKLEDFEKEFDLKLSKYILYQQARNKELRLIELKLLEQLFLQLKFSH